MIDLRPCVECRRHVSIRDNACPFCGTASELAAHPPWRLGRASRAVVFAGAALATSACGGNKPKAGTVGNQQPQAAVDAGVEADAPAAVPAERAPIPMPYGAPPARRRVV